MSNRTEEEIIDALNEVGLIYVASEDEILEGMHKLRKDNHMKVVTAPEHFESSDDYISVFLAGGITNCPNWQNEVIKELQEDLDEFGSLVIFNPRRENFPIHDKSAAEKQIKWEFNMLEKCDIFSMYFSAGESDQPICMYELGRNILRMQMRFPADWQDRIIISVEEDYRRKEDVIIQTGLATSYKVRVNTEINPRMCLANHVDKIKEAFTEFV